MTRARMQDIEQMKLKVIQKSLDLAAIFPWNDIHISQIINETEYDASDILAIFQDKSDILHAYERQIDAQVVENMTDAFDDGDSLHDKLFEILMDRFDVLNEHRVGVISMVNGVTLDAKQMIVSAPWVPQSMMKMMGIAGIECEGIKGTMRVLGVSVAYIKTLRDWVHDDSEDLSKTMANLDNALGYVEKIGWD